MVDKAGATISIPSSERGEVGLRRIFMQRSRLGFDYHRRTPSGFIHIQLILGSEKICFERVDQYCTYTCTAVRFANRLDISENAALFLTDCANCIQ